MRYLYVYYRRQFRELKEKKRYPVLSHDLMTIYRSAPPQQDEDTSPPSCNPSRTSTMSSSARQPVSTLDAAAPSHWLMSKDESQAKKSFYFDLGILGDLTYNRSLVFHFAVPQRPARRPPPAPKRSSSPAHVVSGLTTTTRKLE